MADKPRSGLAVQRVSANLVDLLYGDLVLAISICFNLLKKRHTKDKN